MPAERTSALWYVAPDRVELRETALPPMAEGMVEIATQASLLSRGTERLVLRGGVPASERERMRAPLQEGNFPFPVKYGYAAAGVVTDGPEARVGTRVFALAPHQARLRVPAAMARPIPDAVPTGRAVLAANMETALNAIWDAEPAPGGRVLVTGLGLLGLLVAARLARRGDLDVAGADVVAHRAALAAHIGVNFVSPDDPGGPFDLAFHASATAAGLDATLAAMAFEGTVIELSWYGDAAVPVALGGAFHAQRLTLRSSQVGHVAPSRRARLSRADRLDRALAALDDARLDALVTREIAFADAPALLPGILCGDPAGIATRLRYDR